MDSCVQDTNSNLVAFGLVKACILFDCEQVDFLVEEASSFLEVYVLGPPAITFE